MSNPAPDINESSLNKLQITENPTNSSKKGKHSIFYQRIVL